MRPRRRRQPAGTPSTDTRTFKVKRLIHDSQAFFGFSPHLAAGGLSTHSEDDVIAVNTAYAEIVAWLGAPPPTPGPPPGPTVYVTTTRPALVGTTIAELNAQSPQDGEAGALRVGPGPWPDVHQVELTYYAAQSKWVSDPIPLLTQTDQEYMGPNTPTTTTDKYVGKATVGGGPNQSGWATRYLPYSGELIAAGCSLHAMVSALIQGDGTNRMIVTPYWYSDTTGTAVSHVGGSDVPAAGSVGTGPAIQSGLDAVIGYARSGWTAVTLAGGASGAGKRLWVGLFARMSPATAAAWGNVIDTDVSARWVG